MICRISWKKKTTQEIDFKCNLGIQTIDEYVKINWL